MVWYGPLLDCGGVCIVVWGVVLLTSLSGWEGYVGGVLAVGVAWALAWVMLVAGRFLLTVLFFVLVVCAGVCSFVDLGWGLRMNLRV